MKMSKKKWVRQTQTQEYKDGIKALEQVDTYGLRKPIIEFLYNRGIRTEKDLADIMEKGADRELDPYDMKDVEQAVAILIDALEHGREIVVYGDYDADGVSATVIAVQCLRNLGMQVGYYINNRFVEGYGISPLGVDNLLKQYPDVDLILTVDNGIVAYEGVEHAKSLGLDVVITDHHLAKEEIPDAWACVNPHRLDDDSLFRDICGAAVIYKVMMALYWELGKDMSYVTNMIDLVGMATVGDVMPLKSENRFFVNEALSLIERNTRKQFEILKELKKVGVLNEEVFGFQFVPTINAVGRLHGTPTLAVDFFLTDDEATMRIMAEELIAINDKRKEITKEQEELSEVILAQKGLQKVIVVSHPDFHEGIVGLVAGRLKEKYCRPAIVLSEHEGKLKGSGRSIEGFHIKNALDEVDSFLEGYGGHELAAGLSMQADQLEGFEEAIIQLADNMLTDEDLIEKVNVDAVLNPDDISQEFIKQLDLMRPFGQGFAAPIFGLTTFYVDKVKYMGADETHLKLINNDHNLEVVMFKHAQDYKEAGSPDKIKALGSPKLNSFRGKVSLQFSVEGDCLAY